MVSKTRLRRRCTVYAAVLAGALSATVPADQKTVIGWLSSVEISSQSVTMVAKVDTGADTSSVHADHVRVTEEAGEAMVEFTLRGQDGSVRAFRRPLLRTARVKTKTGGYQERPVVMLQLCVADKRRTMPVNLAQRAHFKYPLLLGRDFLDGYFVVDVSREFVASPACPQKAIP